MPPAARGHERGAHRSVALLLFDGAAAARGAAADQGRVILVLRRERGPEDDVWKVQEGATALGALDERLLTLVLCAQTYTGKLYGKQDDLAIALQLAMIGCQKVR